MLPLLFCGLILACGEESRDAALSVESVSDAQVVDTMVSEDAQRAFDALGPHDAMVVDAETDTEVDATVVDAGVDATVVDAGAEPPSGPIEPPVGTDTTPEDNAFDWSGIGNDYISSSIPRTNVAWSEYPRYGSARVLPDSNSDECVCFDADCSTCSQDSCGAETCTYNLNADHRLTKYHVELRSVENEQLVVTFEVNVSADPPIRYTTIVDVLNRLERVPVAYWYGLKIITHFGRGIQFLHGSYFNGAAAYGSRSYIDTQTVELPTLLHELGHTFEQYTRMGNSPSLEPQSNILDPIWRHAIRSDNNRTSRYGNNNEWEDLAEFSRLYAMATIEGSLVPLQALSPERFRIWERILINGMTIAR